MTYELRVKQPAGYLHAAVTGPNTPEVVAGYLREVVDICARTRCTALLIEENLTGPGLPLAEIYHIVSDGSEDPLAHLLKVAFVNVNLAHPDSSVRFAETVARNRGVNVRAFRKVQDAQEWLRATGPERSSAGTRR